jgi:hypothetical protein
MAAYSRDADLVYGAGGIGLPGDQPLVGLLEVHTDGLMILTQRNDPQRRPGLLRRGHDAKTQARHVLTARSS